MKKSLLYTTYTAIALYGLTLNAFHVGSTMQQAISSLQKKDLSTWDLTDVQTFMNDYQAKQKQGTLTKADQLLYESFVDYQGSVKTNIAIKELNKIREDISDAPNSSWSTFLSTMGTSTAITADNLTPYNKKLNEYQIKLQTINALFEPLMVFIGGRSSTSEDYYGLADNDFYGIKEVYPAYYREIQNLIQTQQDKLKKMNAQRTE